MRRVTAEAVARALGGKRQGREWLCRCPAHDDHEPSLSLRDGDKTPVVVCCRAGCPQPAVLAAIATRTGIDLRRGRALDGNGTATLRRADPGKAERERQRLERWRQSKLAAILKRVQPIAGTPGETYLAKRGLDPQRVPDATVGWLPQAHKDGYGALAVLATDASGAIQGAQLVYLTDAGGKAPVRPVKQSFGRTENAFERACVRLPGTPPRIGAEGPETGLSLWQATGREVWIALGGLGKLVKQTEPGDGIVLARDADAEGSPADTAFARALSAFQARGVRLAVAAPPRYPDLRKTDWNDTLVREGPQAVRIGVERAAAPGGIQPPYWPDRTMPLVEARATLRATVRDFVSRALSWSPDSGQPVPVWGIRGAAGLGKSTEVGDPLAEIVASGQSVDAFVPRLDLAEEAAEAFRKDHPGIPARVFRGRDQTRPDGTPMCTQIAAIKAAGSSVSNIYRAFCDDGKGSCCPDFADCPYIAQRQDATPAVRFLAHNYLALPRPEGQPKALLRIVDEKFWQALMVGTDPANPAFIPVDDLTVDALLCNRDTGLPDMTRSGKLHLVRYKLRRALDRQPFDLAALDAEGLTPSECRFAAGCEFERLREPDIRPDLPLDVKIARARAAPNRNAALLGKMWQLLAEELEDRRSPLLGRTALRTARRDDGTPERRLYLHWSRDVKEDDIPTLLLDADLDPVIARRFFPAFGRMVEIDAPWPHTEVIQIVDRPVSKRMLTYDGPDERERQRAANRRRDLHGLLAVETARALKGRTPEPDQPVAVGITFKGAEAAIRRDHAVIPGLDLTHHGAITGLNRWKGVACLVVAGRPSVGVEDLQHLTAAVFWPVAERFAFLQPDAQGQCRFPTEPRGYRMRDGNLRQCDAVDTHPDSLCRRMLGQIREASLTQALARARPLDRTAADPLRLLVLSNIPLSITVDRLVTWDDFIPDRQEQALARGPALPTSPVEMARIHPDLWASAEAARSDLKRSGDLAKVGYVPVRYWRAETSSDKPYAALVRRDVPDLRAALERMVGPVARMEVRGATGSATNPAQPIVGAGADAPRPWWRIVLDAGGGLAVLDPDRLVASGLFSNREAARKAVQRLVGFWGHDAGATGQTPISILYWDLTASSVPMSPKVGADEPAANGPRTPDPPLLVAYKPQGRRGRHPSHALVDTRRHPDPRAALERVAGPLAHFEIVAASPADVARPFIRGRRAVDIAAFRPRRRAETSALVLMRTARTVTGLEWGIVEGRAAA